MADVTDPGAISWSNSVLRPISDHLAKALQLIDGALVDWGVAAKNMTALFPSDATATVDDGAAADGRTVITGADVQNFITLVSHVQAMADNDQDPATGAHTGVTGRMLIHKIAVNPTL